MQIRPTPILNSHHGAFAEAASVPSEARTGTTIVEVFEAQAATCRHRAAVVSEQRTLSYGELDALSSTIAAGLIDRELDTERPVALALDDGVLIVAAVLGVLKAGGVYLVLDTGAPRERNARLLRQSGAHLLMTDAANFLPEGFRSAHAGGVVSIDDLLRRGGGSPRQPCPNPEEPAVMLFTSGSTGSPLCVVHSQGGILDEVDALAGLIRAGRRDIWLQYASPAFASAIRSTFGALLTGGTLVLYDVRRNGFGRLAETIQRTGVTIYRSLPSTFRHFAASVDKRVRFDSVRVLSLGGEMITGADVMQFHRCFSPHCILLTSYGPTECLGACWGFAEHGAIHDLPRVPMGYARPGKTITIVDPEGRSVPDGTCGEIAVTGEFVADGYRNDDDATRRRFAADPSGARTFYSGDLGVRDRNGLVTHMGRRDFQVKVRGYRVDVFEVEEMMRGVEGVLDAAVVARGAGGDVWLAGYVLARRTGTRFDEAVRERLVAAFPAHMVPRTIDVLDRFPLNPNGKLDRAAFPDGRLAGVETRGSWNEVVNPLQQTLCRILSEVLGIDHVPVDRAFTEMGGDSLVAAQLESLIRKRLGADVPVWRILGADSVAELAEAVESSGYDSRC